MSVSEGGPIDAPQWHITGSDDEIRKLREALSRLRATEIGHTLSEVIREGGTSMRFELMGEASIAYFNPERNEIVINQGLRNASPEILAAHLAHEGTHVQWNRPNSIEQEYHAFRNQAEVWNQLKEDQTDRQCDHVSRLIALGEQEAKDFLTSYVYPDLPEFA
jgi:hypothetical protein